MKNNMQEALDFFRNMELPIKDGLIDVQSLTNDQIEMLKQWEFETEKDGIMMPEIEDFYKSLLVAISTNPQKDEKQDIRYLFGKGFGIEVALRGNIEGRTKYNTNPMYRSHADFELYDANSPYTEAFTTIFGSQEYYPPNRTKGLKNIEPGYMDSTHEIVDIDGYKVLIPQLEILFLDKFLKTESTPRNGEYDCELLAQEYDLDKELIKEYLEKYCLINKEQQFADDKEKYLKSFNNSLSRNLNNEFEESGKNIQLALKELNDRMKNVSIRNKKVIVNGIKAEMYIPITESDVYINEQGKISLTQEYITKTVELIDKVYQENAKADRIEKVTGLEELFKQVERKREKGKEIIDKDDYKDLAYDEKTLETIDEAKQALKERSKINSISKEQGGKESNDAR